MEKITYKFGDPKKPINTAGFSLMQKLQLIEHLHKEGVSGVWPHEEFLCKMKTKPIIFFTSDSQCLLINGKKNSEFKYPTWDDITKPIKPETPWIPKLNEVCFVSRVDTDDWVKGQVTGALGELISFENEEIATVLNSTVLKFKPINSVDEVTNKPYEPKVGEVCEVEHGDDWIESFYIGLDFYKNHTYQVVKGEYYDQIYTESDLSKFRPIQSERERLIDLASKVVTKKTGSYLSVGQKEIIDTLVDSGWKCGTSKKGELNV